MHTFPLHPIDQKPEVVEPDSPPSIVSLFLEQRLNSSDDYIVFQARLSFGQVNLAVVCKFDVRGAEESVLEWEAQKWREVEEWAGIDEVVSPLAGYFERAEKVDEIGGMLVTLRHGERVERSRDLLIEQKQRIYTVYERLHVQGLVHDDPGARNVLYDKQTEQFKLCDLERSYNSR
ncbi:hypothetical protein Rt10032_c14g5327 [Rhodotorula toruloides]|uniref:Protein kinase domain-containing protein n=1 Tax=Rhodotorula toruloides TaxID=5286 RepID=A0A511KLQ2_RHOTO|nr:hypothetical protein Rt10032_c14g5327 [Rhodotorula toruloides]